MIAGGVSRDVSKEIARTVRNVSAIASRTSCVLQR
jgi:hypothetical protein